MSSVSPELLEMRLKRFLHYGSEAPIYMSGDRYTNNVYNKEHVPSLSKLLADKEYDHEKIIDLIVKVKNEDTSVWPDSITFALALCAAEDAYPLMQQQAYKSIRTVCREPRDIILFVKFYRDLKTNRGGGNGFKRAVAQFYLVPMPFDLADIFLQQRSYHGWTHRDVLRVAHIKPISIEQQVLFTYVMKGLEEAANKFGESPNEQVSELLEYITTVEGFRKIKDPTQAAKALAVELHKIERVPSHLMKSQEVWNELIPNMDVKTLLDNLQRISILGFLKNANVTVMKVVDVFNNLHKAETFKGHPSRVFIELMTYEKAAKYCLDIAIKMNHPISKITPARKPPKCNLLIKNALVTFFYSLYKFQKPTGLRYMVAVDVRPKMFSDRCQHCLHLTPIEAAQVVSLSLIRTETEKVILGTFTDVKGDIELVSLTKDCEIAKYESVFQERASRPGPASVAAAIHWATTEKKSVDVFIILSNYLVMTSGSRPALAKYRQDMNLPNTKLITCSLSGQLRTHKDVEGQNMICVVGFDEHVCRLIEVFARGAF